MSWRSASAGSEGARLSLPRRLRYLAEAAGFFAVIAFFRLFDIDRASAIGGWIGRHILKPTPLSRRALANLALAFPEKSDAERKTILDGMWDNLGRVIAEYAHLDAIHWSGEDPRIAIEGLEHVEAAVGRNKGILFVCGHFGNWEMLQTPPRDFGHFGGTIVRPANNPYVNRWLMDLRSRTGMAEQIAKGPQGTKRVFTLLRRGGTICLLVDQRASEGILVPFFGRDAFTTPAPAALALRLGATILPASGERVCGARFRMRVYPPLTLPDSGDVERDVWELTATLTRFIEERVRERPEQWLWIHKRWVDADAPKRKRAQARSPSRGGTTKAASKRV